MKRCCARLLIISFACAFPTNARTTADPALLAEINRIRAVDNHAHMVSVTGDGEREDENYDAIACGKLEFVSPPPMRLRTDNPIYTGGGCGHFFNLNGANPLRLESVLNDPALRKTTFVLVHGGYPFVKETEFLLEKPNVYADFSAQTFLLTPRALSRVLRDWLEYEPEKVLFATDASPATPEVGWEESAWMTNRTAREALALALAGMVTDGDITRERASELARMVLRENAVRLYGLEP